MFYDKTGIGKRRARLKEARRFVSGGEGMLPFLLPAFPFFFFHLLPYVSLVKGKRVIVCMKEKEGTYRGEGFGSMAGRGSKDEERTGRSKMWWMKGHGG